jgi:hypothetical protein
LRPTTLARTAKFVERDQHDSICPVVALKIFLFPSDPNHLFIRASRLLSRGVSRSSRTWAAGCGGRGRAIDEQRQRGRRSRVVLMPRCWRQVRDDASHHTGDGDNKARSPGRARRKPLKPLRGECRAFSGVTVVTTVCFLPFAHGLRAHRAPGIPCVPLWDRLRPSWDRTAPLLFCSRANISKIRAHGVAGSRLYVDISSRTMVRPVIRFRLGEIGFRVGRGPAAPNLCSRSYSPMPAPGGPVTISP